MAEHTPGPWSTECDLPHNRRPRVYGNGVLICEVGNMGSSQDEWEANARLIAAAPELLVAAAEAADVLTDYLGFLRTIPASELERHPYIPGVEQCLDNLRAAIAKARGSHEG